MENKSTTLSSLLLFLLGLGSVTKIFFIGTISFSELVIFFVAPILLLRHWRRMRREGFVKFLYMMAFMVGGMFLSARWNHSPFAYVLKLFAVFYGMFAFYVVFYCLLHDNFKGIGWFFLGSFISGVITIWFFNPTADVSDTGFVQIANADAEMVIRGPLFWIGKVRGIGELPIIAVYLKTPLAYSVITPILFVAFALLTSSSGRAQSMCAIVGCAMMIIGTKSRKKMRNIGRHFVVFMILGIVALFAYKMVYSYAATNGYLGLDAQNKYEQQTGRGKDALSMLIAGRTEFFIALTAVMDHPIIGLGPRAEDYNGYTEKFLLKYGTDQDIIAYRYYRNIAAIHGVRMNIPTHSHIMAAWLWCGIPGLIFFVWVIYVIYQHIRRYSATIPQWYGYFAMSIPTVLWNIFFNPFGARSVLPLLMVCLFFAKAIGDGKMHLPYKLEIEARKYD